MPKSQFMQLADPLMWAWPKVSLISVICRPTVHTVLGSKAECVFLVPCKLLCRSKCRGKGSIVGGWTGEHIA